MILNNAIDVNADGRKAVKLADADPKRRVINIWAGETDLWYGGNKNVPAGTIGHRIIAGENVEIESSAEIWVIRTLNTSGNCSFSEEFTSG